MEVHIISIKDIQEKLDYLNKEGLRPVLFKGTNGKTVDNSLLKEYINSNLIPFLPKSIMGCAISHMRLWEKLLISQKDYYIIFEDDVYLSKDFLPRLNESLQDIPSDFDVFYLGYMGHQENSVLKDIYTHLKREEKIITKNIKIPSLTFGCHAYIISRTGAEKLLKLLKGKIYTHIDYCINREIKRGNLNVYAAEPVVAFQTSIDGENSDGRSSENVSGDHPILLNLFLKKIDIEKGFKADYFFNCSLINFFGFTFNLTSILFLVIGIVFMMYKIEIRKIILIFIVLSSIDLVLLKNLKALCFHFLLMVGPSFVKRMK